jgi:chaperonin GroEL
VVKIGAATEVAMKEKKARAEDAMHATRAAVQEGIVPGGGVALFRAAKAIENLTFEDERRYGVEIVRRAPRRAAPANRGERRLRAIDRRGAVREGKADFGFKCGDRDLRATARRGVIDPTKVCARRSRMPEASPG